MGAAVKGAIEGGAIGLTMGASAVVGISVSVGASAVGSVVEQGISKGEVSSVEVAKDAVTGLICGGLVGRVSNGLNVVSKSMQKSIENHYAKSTVRESLKKRY